MAMTDERARELVEALRELAQRRETYSIEAGQAADEIERLYACRVAEFENAFRESEPACDFDRCQGYVVFRGRQE